MKRLLSRLGCSVSTAENGELALEMILGAGRSNSTPSTDNSAGNGSIMEQFCSTKSDDIKYHVIFLDNQMPVLSGLKAIEKLREAGRRDFVVGVTGTNCKYISAVLTLKVCQAMHFWTINKNI
jgi:osomolarity two-component system, sensor histidine kinase SLN1